MPMAIPLIAAAGSIGLGVAAGASTLMGGLMIAGGVMSGLGAITGNKKLSMLGGVIGLAGGVAGLASGAWTTAADSIANQASSGASAAGEALSQTAAPLADAGAQAASSAGSAATDLAANPFGALDGGGLVADNSQALQAAAKSPVQDLVAGSGGYNPSAGVNPAGITDGVGAQSAINSPVDRFGHMVGDTFGSIKSGLGNVGTFVKDNKELVNLGGGLVGGAMNNLARQRQLQQQADLEWEMAQRRRQQLNQSMQGLQMPVYQAPKGP